MGDDLGVKGVDRHTTHHQQMQLLLLMVLVAVIVDAVSIVVYECSTCVGRYEAKQVPCRS